MTTQRTYPRSNRHRRAPYDSASPTSVPPVALYHDGFEQGTFPDDPEQVVHHRPGCLESLVAESIIGCKWLHSKCINLGRLVAGCSFCGCFLPRLLLLPRRRLVFVVVPLLQLLPLLFVGGELIAGELVKDGVVSGRLVAVCCFCGCFCSGCC